MKLIEERIQAAISRQLNGEGIKAALIQEIEGMVPRQSDFAPQVEYVIAEKALLTLPILLERLGRNDKFNSLKEKIARLNQLLIDDMGKPFFSRLPLRKYNKVKEELDNRRIEKAELVKAALEEAIGAEKEEINAEKLQQSVFSRGPSI